MHLVGKRAAKLIAGISLLALASPASTSEIVKYTYDARGRLVNVSKSGTVNNGVSATYNYDNADNRSNVTVVPAGPPMPGFSINDVTVTEGTAVSFTVTKSGSTSSSMSLTFSTADGSAVAGRDYAATTTTLTFAPTDVSKTVSVPTINNAIVDGTRTFYANLSNASVGSVITDGQGVGTINDDEVAVIPSFTVNDVSANEGSGITFTITKTGLTGTTYTINYATANGTATAGSDYTATTGTLTFAPQDTQKTVTVATIDDTTIENDETFALNLSGASGGATITRAQGVGTILNNDGVAFSINDATGVEGSPLTFTVTKFGGTSSTFTINYATADDTALSTKDYTAKSGTLSFGPAVTTGQITVSTTNRALVQPDRDFFVNLTSTGAYTITRAQGIGTIQDSSSSCGGSVPSC